jgi:hypothetical protein
VNIFSDRHNDNKARSSLDCPKLWFPVVNFDINAPCAFDNTFHEARKCRQPLVDKENHRVSQIGLEIDTDVLFRGTSSGRLPEYNKSKFYAFYAHCCAYDSISFRHIHT